MGNAVDRLIHGVAGFTSLYLASELYSNVGFLIDLQIEVQKNFLPCFKTGGRTDESCRTVFEKIFCWAPHTHPEPYKWGKSPSIEIYYWLADAPSSYQYGLYGLIAITTFIGLDFLHRAIAKEGKNPDSPVDRVGAALGSVILGYCSAAFGYSQYLWNTEIFRIKDMHEICTIGQDQDPNQCREYHWRIEYFEKCDPRTYEHALKEDMQRSLYAHYLLAGITGVVALDLLHRAFSRSNQNLNQGGALV